MKENSDLAFITGWVSKNTLGNITLHEIDFGAKRHWVTAVISCFGFNVS